MENLPRYYTILFNAVTDAITAMEQHNFGTAKALLIQGQQAAETAYIGGKEDVSRTETLEKRAASI
ncbi:hypothetical protein [uncultured Dysosmobacter sp.]|uniref:hypothetical protein n=1 Tax=uncultured Dysosmobacter sp. TaxID=2591384 RepID=UPI00262DEE92|nr:hypothetical protein [uncultured Dysosmobacter sp.]